MGRREVLWQNSDSICTTGVPLENVLTLGKSADFVRKSDVPIFGCDPERIAKKERSEVSDGTRMARDRDVQHSHRSGGRSVSLRPHEDSVVESPDGRRRTQGDGGKNRRNRTKLRGGMKYHGSTPIVHCVCCWDAPVRLRPSVAVPQTPQNTTPVPRDSFLCRCLGVVALALSLPVFGRVCLGSFSGLVGHSDDD